MAQQQFGFSQTMFREQARFTSGRERRIAEMENRQNVTVYNMETAQREKEFGFQKQAWKLQEDQYHIQIKQFNETKRLQQEQLTMSIKFYQEGKKLTEESILLERARWVEEIKNQKASLAIQASQITFSKSLSDAERVRQANELTLKGSLDNLNTNTFPKLIQNLVTNIPNAFAVMVNKIRATAGSSSGTTTITNTSSGGGSNLVPVQATATGDIITAGEWAIAGDISGARSGYEELVHALPGGGAAIYSNTQSRLKLDAIMNNKMLKIGGGNTRMERQPINIYVGTEKLASMVIDIIQKDLAN